MNSQALAARFNPRVIDSLPDAVATKHLAGGLGLGSDDVTGRQAQHFLVVRIDHVGLPLAQTLRKTALSAGAEAAIGRPADGAASRTPVTIAATRGQYTNILQQLRAKDGDGPGLADCLDETLRNYERTDYHLALPDGPLRLASGRPVIMGILNVTPDSFSDGGRFVEVDKAVGRALEMVRQGASIIDIGGESTRPGSLPVSADEEISRVVPVIEAFSRQTSCPVSIDTYKPEVARAAFGAGASIINDITAFGDAEMAAFAAERGCPVILMHMKGSPRTMQEAPVYEDLMGEITLFLRKAVDTAVAAGVQREQIVVDPGIGFGKTLTHNLDILRSLKVLASLGRPILVGTSRKSFIGAILQAPVDERRFGTAASVALCAAEGAHILRVHDVGECLDAAMVGAAIAQRSFRETGSE